MKTQIVRKKISVVEVENISAEGMWISVKEKEYYLSNEEYSWLRDAKVSQICNVKLVQNKRLHWPDLNIDVEIKSLERFKLNPVIFTECFPGQVTNKDAGLLSVF